MRRESLTKLFFGLTLCTFSFADVSRVQQLNEIVWDFGGMYGYGYRNNQRVTYANPATGRDSCPDTYIDSTVFGTRNVDWPVHICYRRHIAGQAEALEFGGLIGGKQGGEYLNPITQSTLCGDGYTKTQILGTVNQDYGLFLCNRKPDILNRPKAFEFGGAFGSTINPNTNLADFYPNPITENPVCADGFSTAVALGSAGVDRPLKYCYKTAGREILWDFGGMFGYGYKANVGRIEYKNPSTGNVTCPEGYISKAIYGTTNVDWPISICLKPHVAGIPGDLDFGGMYGRGQAANYINPLTGALSCPAGFSSAQVLGTVNQDWPTYFCYRQPNVPQDLEPYYEFGGAFGGTFNGGYAHLTINPASGQSACPRNFDVASALGTSGVDYGLKYCFR